MMKEIPLHEIDYVLLDLDGTLLDKYFDDYFWLHLVPEKYAERHVQIPRGDPQVD
jgi:putative hydrolase of the HAD superfamily